MTHDKNGAHIVTTRDTALITRNGVTLRFTRAEVERNMQARGADRGFWMAVLAWMDGERPAWRVAA